jgi:integrase
MRVNQDVPSCPWVRFKLMFLDCLRLNAATRHQVTAQGNALGQVKPKIAPDLIKPPKVKHLPNIVTQAQLQQILERTRVLSYRAFFFTLYSLGLRLGEGLRLQVGDIDAQHQRVHIRDAKGN